MSWFEKYKKWVIGGGVVVFLLILVASIVGISWNAAHSVTLSVMVTPLTARVRVGDAEYAAMGEYKITPGTYAVEVSADGFESRTGELTAAEGAEVAINLYLTPSAGNENYYAEHPDDALILGELKNAESLARLSKLKEEWPVLNELPLTVEYYTAGYAKLVKYVISYRLSDDGFVITVTDYTGGNYADAISKLAARGVTADKVKIEYVNAVEEWGRAE